MATDDKTQEQFKIWYKLWLEGDDGYKDQLEAIRDETDLEIIQAWEASTFKEMKEDGTINEKIAEMRRSCVRLANAHAIQEEHGRVAAYLHATANCLIDAKKCIERGNPTDEAIPLHMMMQSVGGLCSSWGPGGGE